MYILDDDTFGLDRVYREFITSLHVGNVVKAETKLKELSTLAPLNVALVPEKHFKLWAYGMCQSSVESVEVTKYGIWLFDKWASSFEDDSEPQLTVLRAIISILDEIKCNLMEYHPHAEDVIERLDMVAHRYARVTEENEMKEREKYFHRVICAKPKNGPIIISEGKKGPEEAEEMLKSSEVDRVHREFIASLHVGNAIRAKEKLEELNILVPFDSDIVDLRFFELWLDVMMRSAIESPEITDYCLLNIFSAWAGCLEIFDDLSEEPLEDIASILWDTKLDLLEYHPDAEDVIENLNAVADQYAEIAENNDSDEAELDFLTVACAETADELKV